MALQMLTSITVRDRSNQMMSVDPQQTNSVEISPHHARAIRNLVQRERRAQIKLRAMNNLQGELRIKDEKISDLSEKVERLQVDAKRSEIQLSRLLRAGSRIEAEQSWRQSDLATPDGRRQVAREGPDSVKLSEHSDLEADGAGSSFQSRREFSGMPEIKNSQSHSRLNSQSSQTSTDPGHQQINGSRRQSPTNIVKPVASVMPQLVQSVNSFPSEATQLSLQPEVPKELVSKLLNQNERLKKVNKDILKYKGLTPKSYLDQQEYEDIIQQLRMELSIQKTSNERLRSFFTQLKGSEMNNLAKTCAELQERNDQLQRTLVVKQTMLKSFSDAHAIQKKENEKLRCESKEAFDNLLEEIKRLRDVDNKHKISIDSLEMENQLQKEQIVSFKVDYEVCLHELEQANQKVFSQRDMIARLTQESQKYKNELQDGKNAKHGTESRFEFSKPSFAESLSSSLCDTRRSDVGIDGCPESLLLKEEPFSCSNCERSFSQSQRQKYEEHIKKCIDD